MRPIFALIDCNNFFVSCERLFRPDLEGRPVVVLSSNDGCAVSRSNEAKVLGIPMAAPAFKYRDIFARHQVVSFSANFELYGDISTRITNLLMSITPHTEVYSVDESFLDLSELEITDYTAWATEVRQQVLQFVGVPVSIGIAPSKTLAKLASDRAKKDPELSGVLSLGLGENADDDFRLQQTPVNDIWGVGWRLAPRLKAEGVHTARDLKYFSTGRAGPLMGVHGRQMVAELNNISCLPLQMRHKPQQQIMRGRQFGEDTNDFRAVEAAVASLTAKAATHLRRERLLAGQAAVIIRTNRHKPGYQQCSEVVRFDVPTADTGHIAAKLTAALQTIFSDSQLYHKADIMLFDLVSADTLQTDLFNQANRPATHDKQQSRMAAVDALNARYGANHVRYAAQDLSQTWRPRHRLGSPAYTTNWDELPVIKA
ncbi:MAG: Y-family DNA polymerase [Candidatus Saccharimonadales bacterium]